MPTLVGINGSPTQPSKTAILIGAIYQAIAKAMPVDASMISLSEVGHDIMCGLTRAAIGPKGEDLIQLVERADILIVGTPVYRASYTGLLKHLFDLVDRDTMRNRKAVLCATGASPDHSILIDQHMRPLMEFFSIQTAPTGLYALSSDFADNAVSNPLLQERINTAANEVVRLVSQSDCSAAATR